MSHVFVFRPGASPATGVFDNWLQLINAMDQVEGRKFLEFDDSVATCQIPAGTWPMEDVMWGGFGPQPTRPRSTVEILDGARFTDLRMIGGQITIVNKASSVSPISDFSARAVVQIGLRDDCGNAQIANQGSLALFDIGTNPGQFFVQNSLFGISTPGVPSTFPIIRHTGTASLLIINILGLNQTGPNVVKSEAGAIVLFGALSSAAQVAADQTTITTDGVLSFGPIGRIQRLILPLPPAAPATSSLGIGDGLLQPNALIRCDGTQPFTQVLPKIVGGFRIGNTNVPLYSGGQELVVSEVVGGNKLSVGPSPGDTIDGDTEPVKIGRHGSRTFVSDGALNWISTSIVT
jgi:hypothetical protein